MLQRGRMAGRGSRARRPYASLAEALFRLGEIAAIAFFVFAAIKATQGAVKVDQRLDLLASVVAGLMSFVAGWMIRWLMTGNTDLS